MVHQMNKKNGVKKQTLGLLILLILALSVVLGVVVFAAMKKSEDKEAKNQADTQTETDANVEKWQEGVITHNGKKYLYNQEIKTYLLMGIDKDEPAEPSQNYIKGGQSDAIFLLVVNGAEENISIVSINRNTMTRILTCYDTGATAGYKTAQICIQHGYGDGMNLSCTRTVDAISYLFYNLPIHGYLSIRMGAIPLMNDAIGGVEVTVLQDIVNTQKQVTLTEGETVTLTGDEAYAYVRTRDITVFESATDRLRRQEQYITAYIEKLKTAVGGSPTAAVKIYESIEEYIVSSIDFASLVVELNSYEYSPERLYTVPGETIMGETYEEFYVDEDAFYDMILEIFYVETE